MAAVPARGTALNTVTQHVHDKCEEELDAYPLNSVEVLGYRGARPLRHIIIFDFLFASLTFGEKRLRTLIDLCLRPILEWQNQKTFLGRKMDENLPFKSRKKPNSSVSLHIPDPFATGVAEDEAEDAGDEAAAHRYTNTTDHLALHG